MAPETYDAILRAAQQLTREEQDRLIGDLEDAANRATYEPARDDPLLRNEAQERRETGSTGEPLNDPQPYTSPR